MQFSRHRVINFRNILQVQHHSQWWLSGVVVITRVLACGGVSTGNEFVDFVYDLLDT